MVRKHLHQVCAAKQHIEPNLLLLVWYVNICIKCVLLNNILNLALYYLYGT